MNFRFSDSEVKTLVELLSLASLVAEWNQHPAFEGKMAEIDALQDKIYEHLYHAGYSQLVEFNEEEQHFQISSEFEKKSFFLSCYDEFRQETFWEELVIRMADRDLSQKIGFDRWNLMSEEERRAQTVELEKRYWNELEKHGVEHLRLIHPPGQG